MSQGSDPQQTVDLHALNLYARLGVREGATDDEIRRAYKRLLKRIHPDLNSLSGREQTARFDDQMKAANEARDTLLDPEKRAHYDRRLGIVRPPTGPGAGHRHSSHTRSSPRSSAGSSVEEDADKRSLGWWRRVAAHLRKAWGRRRP